MKRVLLDKEEAALEREIERGEWVPVPGLEKEIERYRDMAGAFLKKDKKINIRISNWDYDKIKIRAAEEGLPYQTLISSLIHKYLTGRFQGS